MLFFLCVHECCRLGTDLQTTTNQLSCLCVFVGLEGLASLLDAAVPWQQWHRQEWFKRVVSSEHNTGDRAKFLKNPSNYNSANLLFIFYLRWVSAACLIRASYRGF